MITIYLKNNNLRVNVGKIRKFTHCFWKWVDEAAVFVSWTDVELYFHSLYSTTELLKTHWFGFPYNYLKIEL